MQANSFPELTSNIRQAMRDWAIGLAYLDNAGNYRLRNRHNKGPIAPWNKEIKRAFNSVTDFHNYVVTAFGIK